MAVGQEQGKSLVWARLHESGLYFFCPHCGLSFPHPTIPTEFYRVGYGFCWYCLRRTPIEGGDRRGVVRVGEDGGLYTELYETPKDDWRETLAILFVRWDYDARMAEVNRRFWEWRTRDCNLDW